MKYNYIISFIVIILCTGCSNQELGKCALHHVGVRYSLLLSQNFPSYDTPCINPNNGNEFVYRFGDLSADKAWDLVKMNIETKESEIIYTGFFGNHIQWGPNDDILLEIRDSLGVNIYSLSSDGSEIEALTNSRFNRAPLWNFDGTKFLYTIDNIQPPIIKVVDYNSRAVIKEFEFNTSKSLGTWQDKTEEFVYGTTRKGLVRGSTISGIDSLFIEAEEINDYNSNACFIDENTIFWTHMSGIYVTDLITNETALLRESCITDYYRYPSYSRELDLIVVEKINFHQPNVDEPFVHVTNNIVTMNTHAGEENPLLD